MRRMEPKGRCCDLGFDSCLETFQFTQHRKDEKINKIKKNNKTKRFFSFVFNNKLNVYLVQLMTPVRLVYQEETSNYLKITICYVSETKGKERNVICYKSRRPSVARVFILFTKIK